jgi:hypothetical protein
MNAARRGSFDDLSRASNQGSGSLEKFGIVGAQTGTEVSARQVGNQGKRNGNFSGHGRLQSCVAGADNKKRSSTRETWTSPVHPT